MPSNYVQTPGGVFVQGEQYTPKEQYTYESSEEFLSMVQAEYQHEIDRAAALDSKLGISLPVMATYFFLIIQETDIGSLWNFAPDTGFSFPGLFVLLLYPVTVITAIISLVLMIRAVMTRNYTSVDLTQLYTAKELSRPKEQFVAIIATYYLVSVRNNRKQNNEKAKTYQSAWTFGIVSLVYFALYMSIIRNG